MSATSFPGTHFISRMTWASGLAALSALIFLYAGFITAYNFFFHPLAEFPGPRLAGATQLVWAKHWLGGDFHRYIQSLHERYGPVVRIAPNELSFSGPQSLQDIYGHTKGNHKPFLKSIMYAAPPGEDGFLDGIVGERDPEKHRVTRKLLSHAFSAHALREQSTIVVRYVDLMVEKIAEMGGGADGISFTLWMNWLTFDIIGDLAFGESFGCMENTRSHFWIDNLFGSAYLAALAECIKRMIVFKILTPAILIYNHKIIFNIRNQIKFAKDRVTARRLKPNDRGDFFSHLLSDKNQNTSDKFLMREANILIIGGSETTSTAMTAAMIYLLQTPEVLKLLQNEVRTAFKSSAEISAESVASMAYVTAVIDETLRLCPAANIGLSRDCPGATIDGFYVPKGAIVSTSSWVAGRSADSFHTPLRFDPTRFLPSTHPLFKPEYATDNLAASKPFSLGPRGCIGINLAYLEMRLILAKLVWNFDFERVGKEVDWARDLRVYMMTLKPQVRTRFVKRKIMAGEVK